MGFGYFIFWIGYENFLFIYGFVIHSHFVMILQPLF